MEEIFDLPVLYKGEELLFPAKLLLMGYIYKFRVNVDWINVIFEQDDEENFERFSSRKIRW